MPEQTIVKEPITIVAPSVTPPIAPVEKGRMGRPVPTQVEPPKEVLEMEFKMDDNLLNSERENMRVDEPVVINTNASQDQNNTKKGLTDLPKKEEGKEAEEKKEQTAKPEVSKKEEAPKVEEKKRSPLDVLKMPSKPEGEVKKEDVPVVKEHQARDYSIFDTEEQAAAKQMSNTAFEQFTKLKKASVSGGDSVFYQHPDAYTTHPEYRSSVAQVQQGNDEYAFWQQQLLNCKANKPVKNLVDYDKKTGAPIFGADVQPSPLVEEQLRELMYNTQQATHKAQETVQSIQSKYKQEYQNVRTTFDGERTKRFAWAQNPEMLNATLDLVTEDGSKVTKSVKQIKDDFKSLFPSYLANDMGVEVASDLMVALQMQKAFYSTQTSQEAVKETIKNEERLVEPSSSDKPKGKSDAFGGISEFSASGMPSFN